MNGSIRLHTLRTQKNPAFTLCALLQNADCSRYFPRENFRALACVSHWMSWQYRNKFLLALQKINLLEKKRSAIRPASGQNLYHYKWHRWTSGLASVTALAGLTACWRQDAKDKSTFRRRVGQRRIQNLRIEGGRVGVASKKTPLPPPKKSFKILSKNYALLCKIITVFETHPVNKGAAAPPPWIRHSRGSVPFYK